METLTERQRQILDFITDFLSGSGFAPTVREIAGHFKISIRPVQKHIEALVRKGHLRHRPLVSRGIDLASRKPLVSIPLLGRVPAGVPLQPFEQVEDHVHVERDAVGSGKCFALKVKGDSMTGSGIFDNDTVIVRQQPGAEHNDIVVAMVEGEATVKKLFKKSGDVFLQATNPKYRPIRARSIEILGKVIYLMRKI